MTLADRVKKRREELGWSQDELASRMGYKSRSSINKIEMGRPVSQKIIVRLAQVLDTTPAFLMGWEEDKKEKPTADDGLSENARALIQFAMSVPEEKAALALRLLKSVVEDD